MATTTYRLQCLSHVHVGTGTQFTRLDGVYGNGRWHLIDLDKVLAKEVDVGALADLMSDRNFTWSQFLRDRRIMPSDVTRYSLPCPQDPQEAPVREAIKDAYTLPYLPGTSVKGAIRTAVLWRLISESPEHQKRAAQYLTLCVRGRDLYHEFRQRRAFSQPDTQREIIGKLFRIDQREAREYQQTLFKTVKVRDDRLRDRRESKNLERRLRDLGDKSKWLAQPVESLVLGADPNHDLMRALQVGDSRTVETEQMNIGLLWTYTLRNNQLVEKREQEGDYKTFAECLTPGALLQLDVRLDDFLFSETADRLLRFRGARERAIRRLAETCNQYAKALIATEESFYREHGLNVISDFYRDLPSEIQQEEAFLLNIGWGGGWEMKTVGDLMRNALGNSSFNELRKRYRLGEDPQTHRVDPSSHFPHTRRVVYEGGAAAWPTGWVKVEPIAET